MYSSVYAVENNAPFDTLQTDETLSSMLSFDLVKIATRLKKLNVNKSEGSRVQEFYLKIQKY